MPGELAIAPGNEPLPPGPNPDGEGAIEIGRSWGVLPTGGAAPGAIDDGMGSGIDDGMGSGIDAGIGSGDDDALSKDRPLGAGTGAGPSEAVVTSGLRSRGNAIGSVDGLFAGAPGGTDALEGLLALALALALAGARGATDAETCVRGATESGAGGAMDGARGAIGGPLARGARDAGRAGDAGAADGASDMRRVPGAALAGALAGPRAWLTAAPADGGLAGPRAWLIVALTGAGSRPFVSSAIASAMSGGSPCAVAASS
jgi:hypothetical protein